MSGILKTAEKRYLEYKEREERIIEVATSMFGSLGYTRSTMPVIAKDAGVNVATIYKHFKSKRDLLLACWRTIENETGFFPNDSDEERDSKSPNLVEESLRNVFRFLQESPEKVLLILQLFNPENYSEQQLMGRNEFEERLNLVVDATEEAKRKGLLDPNIDSKIYARCVFGFLLIEVAVKAFGFGDMTDEDEAIKFFLQMRFK